MSIQWRDAMAIDGAVIDDDHRCLIAIINEFEADAVNGACESDLVDILLKLRQYALSHFAREEELQRRAWYPFAEAHHKEHVDLIKRLDAVMEEFRAARGKNLATVSGHTAALLKDWLVEHILHSDRRMQAYVGKMDAARRAMAPLAGNAR